MNMQLNGVPTVVVWVAEKAKLAMQRPRSQGAAYIYVVQTTMEQSCFQALARIAQKHTLVALVIKNRALANRMKHQTVIYCPFDVNV